MKIVGKKVIIYSMLGLMQVAMFSSVAAAAPGLIHNNGAQGIAYLDRDDRHDRDNDEKRKHEERKRKHDERKREENERHEREMKRRPHESEREWHVRQERENERHDHALREIAAILIGIAIGSGSSSGN